MLLEDAGISTNLIITPGQTVSMTGDRSLAQPPLWGSGGFTVQERGTLTVAYVTVQSDLTVLGGGTASLSGCALDASFTLTQSGVVSLSLASMAVPAAVLRVAEFQLSGTGSTLRLAAVTLTEVPAAGELTGTMTVEADGFKAIDSPTPWPGPFTVISGPCAVSNNGRCVGRPGGYWMSETCEITDGWAGGVLGDCGVFDTFDDGFNPDTVALPDGSTHSGSDCPAGQALPPGGSVGWISTGGSRGGEEGSVGCPDFNGCDNGCAAKGTCGLPYSSIGLGGGR